jgi:hypothetical protein
MRAVDSIWWLGGTYLARIDRVELVGFDARALAWFLMAQFAGQIVVKNYSPFAHDMHASLIEENRFIVGVPMISKLNGLREYVSVMERESGRCTYDDAVELAKYGCKHPPHTDGYDTFIKGAMGLGVVSTTLLFQNFVVWAGRCSP